MAGRIQATGIEENPRFSRTRHKDESGTWYSLDNAGIIMPPVTNSIATNLFRIEVVFAADPDPELLKLALARTSARFPYFNVTLKRGFFWYYFNQCESLPNLYSDEGDPCQDWNINNRGTRLFRVRLGGRRLAFEFSHALADGSGGISFVKTMLVAYFRLQGVDPGVELGSGDFSDIFEVGEEADLGEYEDGYQRFFPGSLPFPEPNPSAWHLSGRRLTRGSYRVITGSLDLESLLDEVKRRRLSLTEYLGAIYLDALQELWFAAPRRPRKHVISLEIPVNLRHFFETKTKRNFSLFILLRENLQLGKRSFDELAKRAHYQMRLENDIKSISRQISRNAGGTRNMAVRMVPLVIKDVFAKILFAKLGETMLSGFLSNLGEVKLPPAIESRIESLAFIPAPSVTTLTNASVLSYKGRLVISFGSLAVSRRLERLFFTKLRGLGFTATLSCRGGKE